MHKIFDCNFTEGRDNDVSRMVSQLSRALSITQGAALIHHGSKVYLGRKYALEVSWKGAATDLDPTSVQT